MSYFDDVILVVEDIALIRIGVVGILTDAGFQVLEASNADEAIRVLESRADIRLIFTDVGMPGLMDGIKLTHYVRNRWPPVKLVVASGKALIAESDLPSGARFFSKPYDDHIVIDAMVGLLAEMRNELHKG